MRARWGQNFLVDRAAAERIVAWAAVDGQPVLEIGPGRGALTELLAERAARLWLVEIDPRLAALHRERYAADARVAVVEGDALRLDLSAIVDRGVRVVANLPYESGTAIVASLLARRGLVGEMTVMLQREVVERMAAAPGGKEYGSLSVLTQMTADVEPGMILAPRAFRPRPRVESQVLRLRPLVGPRCDVGDEALFRELVYRVFSMRRKMLRNSLGHWLVERLGNRAEAACTRVFAAAGVAPTDRPEQLPGEAFAALARAVVAEHDGAPDAAGGAGDSEGAGAAAGAAGETPPVGAGGRPTRAVDRRRGRGARTS